MSLGALIGAKLQGGEVIELISDVGGGKTTFVRGLAQGAGSKDHVSSPSFTISNVYATDSLKIVHFDFYRLQDPGLIAVELQDILEDSSNSIVIEWAGLVSDVLPSRRLKIRITPIDELSRQFDFEYPDSFLDLIGLVKGESA